MRKRNANWSGMRKNSIDSASWDDLDDTAWETLMDQFLAESRRVLRKGASAIVFMGFNRIETIIRLAENHGFYYKTTGVWHKTNPVPRNMNLHFVNSTEAWIYFTVGTRTGTFNNDGQLLHDFLESPVTSKAEKQHGKHPTQKPLHIMNHFVSVLSNSNDLVLDPFMGTGSSGVAALSQGRRFIGMEKESEYFDIAAKRLHEASAHLQK